MRYMCLRDFNLLDAFQWPFRFFVNENSFMFSITLLRLKRRLRVAFVLSMCKKCRKVQKWNEPFSFPWCFFFFYRYTWLCKSVIRSRWRMTSHYDNSTKMMPVIEQRTANNPSRSSWIKWSGLNVWINYAFTGIEKFNMSILSIFKSLIAILWICTINHMVFM